MRKPNTKKWREIISVSSFTIKQQMKTTSFRLTFGILLCIALIGPFVAAFLQEDKDSKKPQTTTIENLFVAEDLESELDIAYNELSKLPFYKNLKITKVEMEKENQVEKIKEKLEQEKKNDILIEICEEEQFYIKVYKPKNSKLWKGEGEALLEEMEVLFDDALEKKTNLTKEQKRILGTTVDTNVQALSPDGSRKDLEEQNGIAYEEYMYIYGFIFILLMIGVYAGSVISSTIVSEKNGKVLEYLLTALSPISLLLGKIIGVFWLVIGEILCLGCVAKISDCLAANMKGMGKSVLSGVIPDNILNNLNFLNVMLALLFVILNLAFFGFLAAYAGTRASRVEELKDTIIIFSIGELLGGYLAMFSAIYMMEETTSGFLYFVYMFPLSSSFLLPGSIFTGKIDWRIVVAAIILLFICVRVLISITVKSYQEHLFVSGVKKRKRRGVKN
ncbi:MAG: ABC transporter permease [Lachnospiraceae bacterium]|nr:ABC transporter permease [Lachnospiraceae bacterium]